MGGIFAWQAKIRVKILKYNAAKSLGDAVVAGFTEEPVAKKKYICLQHVSTK